MAEPSDEWKSWFVGFFEGEGSLLIKPNGSLRAKINLRADDKEILTEIRANLGGHLYERPACDTAREQVSWEALGLVDCANVASILGSFTTFDDWLAGFVDAEGSFNIGKDGSPRLEVRLRNDDAAVLHEIAANVGGTVIPKSLAGARRRGINSQDQVRWGMSNAAKLYDCVVPRLEGRMRTKKAQDFAIWAEALEASLAINGGKRHRSRLSLMLEYKRRLEEVRRFVPTEEPQDG